MTRQIFIPDDVTLTPCQDIALQDIVDWWHNPDSPTWCLYGGAGNGKTFLLNVLLQNIRKSGVVVTAITHKAKQVAAKATGLNAETLHSLLGLAPNYNLEEFDVNNVKFDRKNKPGIEFVRLVIVDECSMVNKNLFQYLKEEALRYGVKILYVGDRSQLPPVKERISPTFSDADGTSILVTPARQKPTNPLLLLLYALRYDIEPTKENWKVLKFYADKFGAPELLKEIPVIKTRLRVDSDGDYYIDEPYRRPDGAFEAIRAAKPVWINKGEGYLFYENTPENKDTFSSQMVELFLSLEFEDNVTLVKYIAATNNNIGIWNEFIRKATTGRDNFINDGDLVMGYNTITDSDRIPILQNSVEYRVRKVEPETRNVTMTFGDEVVDVEIEGYGINLQGIETPGTNYFFLVAPKSYYDFFRVTSYFRKRALKYRPAWRDYFAFKNNHLLRDSLKRALKKKYAPDKDIDFSYGITTHKSQGSTYDYVFVNGVDMEVMRSVGFQKLSEEAAKEHRSPTPAEVAEVHATYYRLLYVALSRARIRATMIK